jgi:hypothetical protein
MPDVQPVAGAAGTVWDISHLGKGEEDLPTAKAGIQTRGEVAFDFPASLYFYVSI